MCAASRAELIQLKPRSVVASVFRGVIPPLPALRARQSYGIPGSAFCHGGPSLALSPVAGVAIIWGHANVDGPHIPLNYVVESNKTALQMLVASHR